MISAGSRMPNAVFVSDIHIKGPDCPRALLFTAFLESLDGRPGTTHLFLLGDIFDLWVADHRWFIDRYRAIIGELRRLKSEGVEVHYFEGNHDLYLRYFFGDRLGLQVHDGPYTVELGQWTVRLEHGDEMDQDDRGYLLLRWLLRTALVRILVRNLPGALVARLGNRASDMSHKYVSGRKFEPDRDVIAMVRAHARRVAAIQRFDILISGHVHVRDDSRIELEDRSVRSVNLGSWLDAPCFFLIDDRDAQFHELTKQGLCRNGPAKARRKAAGR